jgi:hypothetical protein
MSSIDQGCPLASPEIPNAWADAATSMQRWNQVTATATEEALAMGHSADQATDYAQVTAWLDCFARTRRLRVGRSIAGLYNEYVRHIVSFLEEVDGELNAVQCGGYAEISELRRSGDANWPFEKDDVGDGWVRMDLMMTDRFPDHEVFQRPDGSRIDLGFNDNEHYYIITVTMHQDDLIDEF